MEHYRDLHDHMFVKKLEFFNEGLYHKLEVRRKAIANWRRLKVVLVVLKICGNRMDHSQTIIRAEQKKQKFSFDEWMGKYIILPNDRSKKTWNIFISNIYLISFFLDTFDNCFLLYPLLNPISMRISTFFSFFMIVDIILTFMTAYKKELKIEFDISDRQPNRRNKIQDAPVEMTGHKKKKVMTIV